MADVSSPPPVTEPAPAPPSGRRRWRPDLRALAFLVWRQPQAAGGQAEPLQLPGGRRSLFGEVLDWMLAPLLLLWPLSVTITYLVAQNVADVPYDRRLTDAAELLAERWREPAAPSRAGGLPAARDALAGDGGDGLMLMVRAGSGELLAGQRELPLPPEAPAPGTVRLRDDRLQGNDLRIAYLWIEARPPGGAPMLIQVAETSERRSQLANEIVRGVVVPQFIVLPVAVVLVWFGLSRGLRPLAALQEKIRARRPDDLSPIEAQAAPEEMAPLLTAFNELLARMRQNQSAQKRFIADAAHQMKTPLAGMRTQAELALRETDAAQLRRSLAQIGAATERATHLINQLLALARAEHQANDPAAFEAVDLVALAHAQLDDWVPQALARGIDLGYEGENRPLRVVAVPLLLRELLNNLIDNALRYTPAQADPVGSVTVRVRRAGASAYLEVEDTGPGIAERERPLVFDRFYRVLGSAGEGSGLGLSIVREIAEQHDALLRVGANPRAPDPRWPGTLISVEFVHLLDEAPTLALDD